VKETLRCPLKCTYNNYEQRCIPNDSNYVCEIQRALLCPYGCNLDPYGEECILEKRYKKGTCRKLTEPYCNYNCYYDKSREVCIPYSPNNVCEPIVKLTCPEFYSFNLDVANCTQYNTFDICRKSMNVIQYPKRLENKYRDIKCESLVVPHCDIRNGVINKCPDGCTIDKLNNRCVSNNKSTICGGKDIQCPTNFVKNRNGCFPRNHDEEPECKNGYRVVKIKNQYRCLPIWYYGN